MDAIIYRAYTFGPTDPAANAVAAYELRRGKRPAEIYCHPDDAPALRQALAGVPVVADERRLIQSGTLWIPN